MMAHEYQDLESLMQLPVGGQFAFITGSSPPFYAGVKRKPAATLLESVLRFLSARKYEQILIVSSAGEHLPGHWKLIDKRGIGTVFSNKVMGAWWFKQQQVNTPTDSDSGTPSTNTDDTTDNSSDFGNWGVFDQDVQQNQKQQAGLDEQQRPQIEFQIISKVWRERFDATVSQIESLAGYKWHHSPGEYRKVDIFTPQTLVLVDETYWLSRPGDNTGPFTAPNEHLTYRKRLTELVSLITTQVKHLDVFILSPDSPENLRQKIQTQRIDADSEPYFTLHYGSEGKTMRDGFSVSWPAPKIFSFPAVDPLHPFGEVYSCQKGTLYETLRLLLPDISSSAELGIEEALSTLNQMIGLKGVKQQVKQLLDGMRANQILEARARQTDQEGMKANQVTGIHYVFTGNPGTGKTTVARLMANIFKTMGVLPENKLVEVGRSGLVGEYSGHTAPKTYGVIDSAMGGVLFIDEAYDLKQGASDTFGMEAINALLKRLEDDRGKFICIVAGYKQEMKTFINANPGLQSRFTEYIDFEDYDDKELFEIFISMVQKKYHITDEAQQKARTFLQRMHESKGDNFGNGRNVRQFFEKTEAEYKSRLVNSNVDQMSDQALITFEGGDIEKGIAAYSRMGLS